MKKRNKEPQTHPAVEKAFQDMFNYKNQKKEKENEDSMEHIEKEDHFNFKVSTHTEENEEIIKEIKKDIIGGIGAMFMKMK